MLEGAELKKSFDNQRPVGGKKALGMKLNAMDRMGDMGQTHDQIVRTGCGHH